MSKIKLDIESKPIEIIPLNEKKHIDLVPLNEKIEKPVPETELSLFEFIKAKYYHIKIEGEIKMWNTIKDFLVGKIVQWILKVGAGVLLSLGISNQSVEEIIAAIVSLVLGIVYSLLTHKKVALTDPKVFMN